MVRAEVLFYAFPYTIQLKYMVWLSALTELFLILSNFRQTIAEPKKFKRVHFTIWLEQPWPRKSLELQSISPLQDVAFLESIRDVTFQKQENIGNLPSGGSGGGIPSALPDSGGVQGWWKQCWRSGCCCHAHWPTNAIRNGTGGCPQGIILTFVMLWVQFEEMMAEASKHRLGAFSPYFHLGSAIEVILRIFSTARSSL